jgi:tetratricopeptide (TPR) repeat protein
VGDNPLGKSQLEVILEVVSITTMSSRWKWQAPFAVAALIIILVYCWSAETGFFEINSPQPEDSYYNLLVQGFRAGQLNVKRDAPPELAKLSNPYDPAQNAASAWDIRHLSYEMSFYQGKLYLYFGVTPALVLFWPYAALTGHYCTHRNAVVCFDAVGILVVAWLVYSAWRRYFPETNVWMMASGVLALGLAPCFMDQLSMCDVHEVPRSCGFAFTMLALAAVWKTLHQPKHQIFWLSLASLAYALAVGSRPSLLPGIIILLIPVIHSFRSSKESASAGRSLRLLLAAVLPAMLVGVGLAAYNLSRFDNPFEFGWRYQLTDTQNTSAHPFSLHYLWYNFRLYFLQPLYWNSSFPFIQAHAVSPEPANYYGVGSPYCGILVNYPLVWPALGISLLWGRQSARQTLPLRLFLWAVVLLFFACALTLCCFFCGSSSYLSDFMPPLMILAVIGACALENAHPEKKPWRYLVRSGWCLLLSYSMAVSILAGFKTHAYSNYVVANSLFHGGRNTEAIAHFEKSTALDPNPSFFYTGLGNAYTKAGKAEAGMIQYKKAIERDPGNVEAMYDLSLSLIRTGHVDEAAAYFQKIMELRPDFLNSQDPGVENNTAWALATNPEATKRNGRIAVLLAEAANRGTGSKTTIMVGTLAAAYAEAGRFDDAISTAQKACALAAGAGDQDLLKKNRELMSLYRKHTAYHEASATAGQAGDLK